MVTAEHARTTQIPGWLGSGKLGSLMLSTGFLAAYFPMCMSNSPDYDLSVVERPVCAPCLSRYIMERFVYT